MESTKDMDVTVGEGGPALPALPARLPRSAGDPVYQYPYISIETWGAALCRGTGA
jgi:hypothetical protein